MPSDQTNNKSQQQVDDLVVACDLGGTFTDIVIKNSKGHFCSIKKVLTGSLSDSRATAKNIAGALHLAGLDTGQASRLMHATTLAPVLSIWPQRFADYPATKATGEDYGIPWQPLVRWRALFVHKDTPKEIVHFLEAVFRQAWESDEHQNWLEKKGMRLLNSYRSRAETKAMAAQQIDTYSEIYRVLGYPAH